MSRPLDRRDFLRMLSVGLGLSAVTMPIIGRPVRAFAAIEALGGSEQVDFGDIAAFDNPTTLSYCFWLLHFGTLGSPSNHGLLGKSTSFFSYSASATANNLAAGVSGASERLTGANVIPNAVWNHAGYIYDDVALKILANGVNQSLTGTEPNFPGQGTNSLKVFSDVLTIPSAHIAIFKAWSAVLTIAEMQQEMESFRPHRISDLVLWAPGEDSNRMTDYSGFDRHGTFVSGARRSTFSPPVAIGD